MSDQWFECGCRLDDHNRKHECQDHQTGRYELRKRIAQLEGALKDLRDYFAYGQKEHTGMAAVATPRCSPSAWKEIKIRVDTVLNYETA